MYPTITKMRDEALTIAQQQGYLHMGLGARIYVDDVQKDSRTLFNSLSQFWSILTLISCNELHYQTDQANLQDDIKVNATIYDALYGIVRNDPESIQWLNNTICPIMEKDFMTDQLVHNEANLEIGTSWANLVELPHNATTNHIAMVEELLANGLESVAVVTNEHYVCTMKHDKKVYTSKPLRTIPECKAWVQQIQETINDLK